MRHPIPPWAATLLVSVLAAALVAGAANVLSRQVERVAEKPAGNRVDDAFRETVRRIDELEALWQAALESESKRMLESGSRGLEPAAIGVEQVSWLNPGFSDPSRAHLRADGREALVKPVLERFAKGETGEWVFPEEGLLTGSDWIEQPGHPPAWRQGNGKVAVILLLRPQAAVETVLRDLGHRTESALPPQEPGGLEWLGPDGSVFLRSGQASPDGKPDEILRHVSRFGDWTLRRFYPVREVSTYRPPILIGGFSLAALLLAGGIAIASWQRKAIRLAEQRVSFVNRVSHELRTPLTNLLLNTDLALDSLPTEEGSLRKRLARIREETSRLSRIVDNVQTFARIERGKSDIRPAACDLRKLVDEMRENFTPLFARKSIVCSFECALDREISVDRDALSQILSNLLSNVEKYSGPSAIANVSVREDDGRLVVEVADNGPGIPTGARLRIFKPFERAGSRVDEGSTGTGLGLAISRDLAGQMGGTLELMESARGSIFRLMIPLGENPLS